ncbi:MAG: IS4 family transposase [Synechococcaceae cyanobacterium SM2_3_2]|nr:IS4 family transposase [Synechococcaceae cyanobacterium SM2_3_2]
MTFAGRRKALQRLLTALDIKTHWFPVLTSLLKARFLPGSTLYLIVDRTQWKHRNLLMASLVWGRRSIPIYWTLLDKQGCSNLSEQIRVIDVVQSLFVHYRLIVLGDREFCSVRLAEDLASRKIGCYSLRLRKTATIQFNQQIQLPLRQTGLRPGTSFFWAGVKVTKAKGFGSFNFAAKWQRKSRYKQPEEAWFILTSLGELDVAIKSYRKRFRIEDMFRDLKSGGYQLERTQLSGERLEAMIMVIAMAYTSATIKGEKIRRQKMEPYVGRTREPKRATARHSTFYLGLWGLLWDQRLQRWEDEDFTAGSKTHHHRRALRAAELIRQPL